MNHINNIIEIQKITQGLIDGQISVGKADRLIELEFKSRVNAISDEMIKDIIFKNQCYGNSTKMVKEIKSLLKQ